MDYDKENKHFRVGLFGVSRSGKNYTIDDFIELGMIDHVAQYEIMGRQGTIPGRVLHGPGLACV